MAGRYKDSTEFMTWYHSMDANTKRIFNLKRREKEKLRLSVKGQEDGVVTYKKKNPGLELCKALHKRAIGIPNAIIDTSCKPQALVVWYEERLNQPCCYCGSPSTSIDHIEPLSRGGKHSTKNLQVICWPCNRAKAAMSNEEYLEWLNRISSYREERMKNNPEVASYEEPIGSKEDIDFLLGRDDPLEGDY
jgi:5-methylcytosine-specific restriction endonuclease McrA